MTDAKGGGSRARRILGAAAPIMIAYVAIGLPCGIMESKAGMAVWMAGIISCTFYTGAGQFMIPGMVMAQASPLSIILSVSFVNTRQILYSTACAPYFAHADKGLTAAFAATMTDESFGVNLDLLSRDKSWKPADSLWLNILCMTSWTVANIVGAAVGPVISLPTAMMSFAMTGIFICLLVTQPINKTTVLVAAVTFLAVGVCKAVGLAGPAIFLGALAGVVAGIVKEGAAS